MCMLQELQLSGGFAELRIADIMQTESLQEHRTVNIKFNRHSYSPIDLESRATLHIIIILHVHCAL